MSEFWIQTFSGLKFDLLEPTEDMICIEDIAHHLATLNRFVGAAKFPYSVGYHCILSCKRAPVGLELETLLHEIDEPYINDISFPFKQLLDQHSPLLHQVSYQIKILAIIKFNLCADAFTRDILKEIDCRMAITEEQQLMKNSGYLHGKKYQGLEPFPINIMERNWRNVELEFLDLYNKYKRV